MVLALAVGGVLLYIFLWNAHSTNTGKALIKQFESTVPPDAGSGPSAVTASLSSCHSSAAPGTVQAVVKISKLNMTAPVEQGVDDAELNVAVGHLPSSVWPGQAGNAVLESHDVSYFANLANLTPGDQIVYESPCTTYLFKVTGHKIVKQGSPVYNTRSPSITLITCWPLNALWFTSERYLVTGSLVSSAPTAAGETYLAVAEAPQVPVPADLASQGVTLATYSLPMGLFTLAGSPNVAWSQTTAPLLFEDSGVEAYIAGVKALTEKQLSWWSAIAPGVTAPAPLVGADNPKYQTALNVTVLASGSTVSAVALTNTVVISGGRAPGTYAVTVDAVVRGNSLVISSWTMTAA